MLIDRYLPQFDATQVAEIDVGASPEETFRAIREANLMDPVIETLFALREIPARVAERWQRKTHAPKPSRITFDDLLRPETGLVLLGVEPGKELVLGSIGRFWRADYGHQQVQASDFVEFHDPGYAKLAISLAVRPRADGTVLRYEARTQTTDLTAWRAFHRYWRGIHYGVALVMRHALRRIRQQAERHTGSAGPARRGTRGFFNEVVATRDEQTRVLPGDRFIADAVGSFTHAITVSCAPGDVWPWLVQMGAGRAGWYSYDMIDNGGAPSAEAVLPQFQQLGTGALFPGLPNMTDGFVVLDYALEQFLVLGWPDRHGGYGSTWAFVLEPAGPGATRLIVRARGGGGYRLWKLPTWLAMRVVPLGHFVMQRKQLLGIARRAERHAQQRKQVAVA